MVWLSHTSRCKKRNKGVILRIIFNHAEAITGRKSYYKGLTVQKFLLSPQRATPTSASFVPNTVISLSCTQAQWLRAQSLTCSASPLTTPTNCQHPTWAGHYAPICRNEPFLCPHRSWHFCHVKDVHGSAVSFL